MRGQRPTIKFTEERLKELKAIKHHLPTDAFKRKVAVEPMPQCDITALCKYMTLLAPPGPGGGEEAYLTTLSNKVNRLVTAVKAIETVLFDPLQAVQAGYSPYFITDPVTGNDPPEKGGTPPPPGFPPP
jgi:hypothetical protein